MRCVVFCLLAFALSFAAADLAPLLSAASAELRVDGEYLVLFKHDIPDLGRSVQDIKAALLGDGDSLVKSVFNIGPSFKALHVKASPRMVGLLRAHPAVAAVEENQVVSLSAVHSCSNENNAIWNLDRINHQQITQLDGTYKWSQTAEDIDAYIIDTGILTTHVEFSGDRAIWGANYVDNQHTDCNGHGTHVAGTVGGQTVGVARNVTLIAVKVLSCSGSGTNAGVISGIQFAAENAKKRGRRSVANMSLGGGYSATLNSAVASAVKAGLPFAVAAGNENQDACNVSPASEPLAITVGATYYSGNLAQDIRASFSNYGTCVDIFAPGQSIKSAWIGSNTAYNTISGTSMASPHVAGVAALVLANNPSFSPAEVEASLIESATSGVIDLKCSCWWCNCESSPNKLLFTAPC
jgi:hypothetical protein